MSRRSARFTQADVERALRAVEKTGLKALVEIAPNGTIRIVSLRWRPPGIDLDIGDSCLRSGPMIVSTT